MSTKSVLIIDDEETIQTVVEFGIRMAAGWEVWVASSGLHGIEIAQKILPDAILLDVMMPEMDGIATFQALNSELKTKDIPVIFLTAKAQAKEKYQFKKLGVSGIITKPFNSLDLPEKISRILNWQLNS